MGGPLAGRRLQESYYRSIYFHTLRRQVDAAYERYLSEMAAAWRITVVSATVFPVILMAMEMLDRDACEAMAAEELGGAPIFTSDKYNMYELVSVLRACRP